MAKHDRKGRSKTGGKFVALPEYLLASEAWGSLTPTQRVVYIELRRVYNGTNNGCLALSVRNAATRCNVHRNSVGPALKVLHERGLTECATPSSFGTNARRAAEYRLTDQRCDRSGAPPSKAFLHWRIADARHNPSDKLSQIERQRGAPSGQSVAPIVTVGAG